MIYYKETVILYMNKQATLLSHVNTWEVQCSGRDSIYLLKEKGMC